MRVKIDAGGREVEIDCADTNVTVKDIAAEALSVWQATEAAKDSEGPAYGFTQDRRGTYEKTPMSPGGYGNGYMREVDA